MDRLLALSPTALVTVVVIEVGLLWYGSRRIQGSLVSTSFWRPLAYPVLLTGTVLHELAHLLMAVVLRVGVTKVELFRPRTSRNGSIQLGMVGIGPSDLFRATLVSVAPVMLVPPVLLLAIVVLSTTALPLWAQLVAFALIGFGSLGAFPSPGDQIQARGLLVAIAIPVVIVFGVYVVAGPDPLRFALAWAALALAVPATSILILLLALFAAAPRYEEDHTPTVIIFRAGRPSRPLFPRPSGRAPCPPRPRWRP